MPWGRTVPAGSTVAHGAFQRFGARVTGGIRPSERIRRAVVPRRYRRGTELGVRPVTNKTDVTQPGTGLIEALHVTGPAAEHADKLMLFGRFVGSWCLEWTGPDGGGQPATMTGELHFGWVLGGRAVQDIWIVPGRGEPGEGQPPWRSTARPSGSTTPRSMPGAPPGSNRSTAGYDASSAGRTAPTLCSSATRMIPNCGGASPTSRRTRSRGAPRVHATRVPAGTSTSKCWPPEITPPEPAHYRNRSAYGMQASRELAPTTRPAGIAQIWLIGAPGPAPSRSSFRARIRRSGTLAHPLED